MNHRRLPVWVRLALVPQWLLQHDLLVGLAIIPVAGAVGWRLGVRQRRRRAELGAGATATVTPAATVEQPAEALIAEESMKQGWLAGWDVRRMSPTGARWYALAWAAVGLAASLMWVPLRGRGLSRSRLLYNVTAGLALPFGMVWYARWADRMQRQAKEDPKLAAERRAERWRRFEQRYPAAAALLKQRWQARGVDLPFFATPPPPSAPPPPPA